jgi:MOSC domain-containing protein YiiM
MPTLLSVNVGSPEPLPGRTYLSGIRKRSQPGPVEIGALGLTDDAVLDKKHHGGLDQAVYLYLQSDYDWWMEELQQPLDPGTFGENLTIGGLAGDTLSVGDRLAIGPVLIEITSHRAPCATLAARIGDPKFVRRFHRARRPGAYCRVLQPGAVEAGTTIAYTPYSGTTVRLTELVDTEGERQIDPALIRRALQAPIHYKIRADFETRLAAGH